MIRIVVTPDMIKRAEVRSEKIASLNGSIIGSPANFVGALGEILVETWFEDNKILYIYEGDKKIADYRLLFGEEGDRYERSVEIKTKDRTVPPKSYFAASVAADSLSHQHPDWFVFVSLYRPVRAGRLTIDRFTEGYIVGCISDREFREKAIFWREGDIDDGMTIRKDCYNLQFSELKDIAEIA